MEFVWFFFIAWSGLSYFRNLNIPISDYSYDDCVVMTKAKDMNIPYPADIIEIRRYRQKLG